MGVLLSSKEHKSHECSNYDNNASHHLVDTSGAHGQGDEHEGRAADIEEGWERNKQWVHLIILGAWGLAVNSSLESVKEQAEEFSKEHDCTLEVRMSELLGITILVSSNDYLVLHLHNDGVQGTEQKHQAHHAVQSSGRDSFALLFFLLRRRRSC